MREPHEPTTEKTRAKSHDTEIQGRGETHTNGIVSVRERGNTLPPFLSLSPPRHHLSGPGARAARRGPGPRRCPASAAPGGPGGSRAKERGLAGRGRREKNTLFVALSAAQQTPRPTLAPPGCGWVDGSRGADGRVRRASGVELKMRGRRTRENGRKENISFPPLLSLARARGPPLRLLSAPSGRPAPRAESSSDAPNQPRADAV